MCDLCMEGMTDQQKRAYQAAQKASFVANLLGVGLKEIEPDDIPEIGEALRKVAEKAALPMPVIVADLTFEPTNAGSMTSRDKRWGILVNPALPFFHKGRELEAMLAHELGHLVNGDQERLHEVGEKYGIKEDGHIKPQLTLGPSGLPDWGKVVIAGGGSPEDAMRLRNELQDMEFKADQYAKSLGYGKELAKSLADNNRREIDEESFTHPAPRERIRRLLA